jgi:hypothetical protein
MLYPRRVIDFLQQFVDREMVEHFWTLPTPFIVNPQILSKSKKSFLTFSYFHQCKRVENPIDFTRTMLYRGCASITPTNYPGADLILPLISADDRLGNILVKVKFIRKSYLSQVYCALNEEGRIGRVRDLLKRLKRK